MSLEAVPLKRNYQTCQGCTGSGEMTHYENDQAVTQECNECGGDGEIYVGPSTEPEDYLEDEQ